MISVIIPTLDAQHELAACLGALVPATIAGLVREVIIVDGGSGDDSVCIADEAGAKIIHTKKGRGLQLAAGGREARGPWLLFLHADTVLEPGWCAEVEQFLLPFEEGSKRTAVFRFALNDQGFAPRVMELMVRLRSRVLKLPYGDQGLLIHKAFYDQLGGFAELPLMEDVEIISRIRGRDLHFLTSRAVTSAARYRHEGYARRIGRNLYCLIQYYAGVAPTKIARTYDAERAPVAARKPRDGRS